LLTPRAIAEKPFRRGGKNGLPRKDFRGATPKSLMSRTFKLKTKMKKLLSITFIMAVIIFAIFTSCKKEEGPQGPAGPAGADGNANVHTKTFTNVGWIQSGDEYFCDLIDTDITQDISDNGSVQVYCLLTTNTWIQLPWVYPVGGYTNYFNVYIYGSTQKVRITKSCSAPPASDPGTSTFKVVCTEGN